MTDNTNADPDTRAQWVTLSNKLNVPIRCTLFTAPTKLCEHNDAVRAMNLGPEVSCASIPTFTTVLEPYPKVLRKCWYSMPPWVYGGEAPFKVYPVCVERRNIPFSTTRPRNGAKRAPMNY
jgi:hypothetical protein